MDEFDDVGEVGRWGVGGLRIIISWLVLLFCEF